MAEYSFEIDWFSHNAPTWAALLSRLGKVQRILEIGSYEGRSATWFMENAFRNDAEGEIVCIDGRPQKPTTLGLDVIRFH